MKSINKLHLQLHVSAPEQISSNVETFSKPVLAYIFLGSDEEGERLFYTQNKFKTEMKSINKLYVQLHASAPEPHETEQISSNVETFSKQVLAYMFSRFR